MASFLYAHLPSVVGVIGAGTLGKQLASLCAAKGLTVLLSDIHQDALDRSLSDIHEALQHRSKLDGSNIVNEHMGRIHASVELEPYKRADFIIEAVVEDEEVKKSVFKRLDQVAPVHAILASNTSSISITRLAKATSKPHRVVGMHFTSPIEETPMVELAKGMHTSNQTYLAAKSLAESLGMQTVYSEDRPGFVMYRMMISWINEAFFCLMEGSSTASDIDRGLRLGMGLSKHGPLAKADLIGLDTCLSIMKVLHLHLGDKYRPCPLLAQYVDAGFLGVKTGRGVFSYEKREATKRLMAGKDRISIT